MGMGDQFFGDEEMPASDEPVESFSTALTSFISSVAKNGESPPKPVGHNYTAPTAKSQPRKPWTPKVPVTGHGKNNKGKGRGSGASGKGNGKKGKW